MAKQKAVEEPEVPEEGHEEGYGLVYNMWNENLTINVYDGGTVILQTGEPKNEPPKGGGG